MVFPHKSMIHLPAQYIQGLWTHGKGSSFSSLNPASGEPLWEGRASDSEDIETAISAARNALPVWMHWPLEKRVEIISAFRQEVQNQAEFIAWTIAQETGKPLWEAKNEVSSMEKKIPISIQSFHERCDPKKRELLQYDSYTRPRPHGIVAVLGPFNFPGHLPNGHIIPALLAGNCVVFKPSELTPLTAIRTVECWERTPLPPGVLQLVQGDGRVGKELTQHPGVKGVFFTGSYRTGKSLQRQAIERDDQILALEMGGNNPLIFGDVQDRQAAVYTTLVSAFITTGQRCTCARRLILLNTSPSEMFLRALIKATKSLRVGAYDEEPQPFMGPMISKEAAQAVLTKQEEYVQKGGKILLPIERLPKGETFLTPGIMDVTEIEAREDVEIFGPFLQVIRVDSLEEAVREANQTAYGLAAGILTDNPKEYAYFSQHTQAGIVNWNAPLTGASSSAPFGGIGKSGNYHPSAFYASDYCSYPVASMEAEKMRLPKSLLPGVTLD